MSAQELKPLPDDDIPLGDDLFVGFPEKEKEDREPRSIATLELVDSFPFFLTETLKLYPGTILAGGAIRSQYDNTVIADYDLFFTSEEIAKSVIDSLGEQFIVFKCPEGKLTTIKRAGCKIQCITPRYYQDAFDVIEDFDIRACKMALYWSGVMWHDLYQEGSREDAANRRIEFGRNRIQYPIATINRIRKYQEKGYEISTASWIKLLNKIRELDQSWIDDPESVKLYID